MSDCPDCFKEQRSLNDQLQQVKIDAQQYANKEKKEVAILAEAGKYTYAIYTYQQNTIAVVKPL